MPTSPAQWEAVAEELRRIYAEAETIMLARVARRLERGIEDDGWAEAKLAEVQQVRRDAEAQIRRVSRQGRGVIENGVREAYRGGDEEAVSDLRKALDRPVQTGFGTTQRLAVQRLATEAVTRVESTHLRILRVADDVYRRTIAEASAQVVTGAQTRRQAAQAALDRFADAGITGFVDRAGRSWDIASYAEMATRTASGNAAVEGHLDRLTENGYDLVIVSDSPDECPLCRPWEGRVLSVSGTDPEHSSVEEARAAGLFHANCTHSLGAFIPGLTEPLRGTRNPEGFETRQRQRQIERNIRRWKRREAVAIDDAARQQARAKVREWQAAQRAHLEEAGRDFKRDYGREQIRRAR